MDRADLASMMVAGALLLAGVSARADGFLEPPGSGKLIVTGGFEGSSVYLDASGARRSVADYRKFILRARTEYGVSDRLTLMGGLESGVEQAPGQALQGAGAIGARALMFRRESLVFSAATLVSAGTGLDTVSYGARGASADMRMEAGYSFKALDANAFVTLSAGALMATGGGREKRLDATLGVRPRDDVMLLLQTFSRFTQRPVVIPGSPRRAVTLAFQDGSSHKAQVSVVWDFLARWSAQLGAFATLTARNERPQAGAFAALWRRF